ncbi:MAG: sigma-70 family RNA polymerase sigma factor [Chloroflexota bacterium]
MTSNVIPFPGVDVDGPRAQDDRLEALFLAHAGPLRRRLLALTRDSSIADDLVSEAFLRLALEMRGGRAPLEPRAWLFRVGSNLVVSRARRASVATKAMPALYDRSVADSPEDEILTRERDQLLREGLASLAERDRKLVALAAQGYRPEEIAGMIGCSHAATRTRLCRARGRLRTQLELAGMTA